MLDAYIAMIPKTDGDATPLGQRPQSVLPVVYRYWASSARMVQLDGWFRSWVPDTVFSAGGGRSSVKAWYTTALCGVRLLLLVGWMDGVGGRLKLSLSLGLMSLRACWLWLKSLVSDLKVYWMRILL